MNKQKLSKKDVLRILKKNDFYSEVKIIIAERMRDSIMHCFDKVGLGSKKEENAIYLKHYSNADIYESLYSLVINYTPHIKVYDDGFNFFSERKFKIFKKEVSMEIEIENLGDIFKPRTRDSKPDEDSISNFNYEDVLPY